MHNVTIIKLGGSVVTHKGSKIPRARISVIRALAKQLALYRNEHPREKLVIVHGAGSFGHPTAKKYRLNDPTLTKKDERGAALTHALVCKLSTLVCEELIKAGNPAFSLTPASLITQSSGRIASFDITPIENLLARSYIPLLHGDVVLDKSSDISICSGDQIVSFLARKLPAKRVIFLTDVDRVYDADPHRDKSDSRADVTGGMQGKLAEIQTIPCPVFLGNGLKQNALEKIMAPGWEPSATIKRVAKR